MDLSEALGYDFLVLGDPVAHSLSPKMHMAGFAAAGLGYRYGALRVPATDFAETIPQLMKMGLRGANVTVPLKELAAQANGFEADSFVRRTGSTNTIDFATRRLYNTDGPGFIEVLDSLGVPSGASVLILGAGGTARTLLVALSEEGYKLSAWNRTTERLAKLLADLAIPARLFQEIDVTEIDVVVNATSSGLQGPALEIPWQGAGLAIDLMYAPTATAFMQDAQRHGWQTQDGRSLLVAQGALSWEIWHQSPAPREAMAAALVP